MLCIDKTFQNQWGVWKSQNFKYGGFMAVIQSISEFAGLPPLVIEVVFLLLLTFVITIIILFVLAIFRIKNELIKMNYSINYITRFLERGYKNRKLYKVNYDRESENLVFEMLRKGKSHEEILKNVRVSKDFIEIIEEVATEKGLLPKKNQQG
jgi:hypothetical protein